MKKVVSKFKLKKGDPVLVICGRDKGKSGKISEINRVKGLVKVDGVNLRHKCVKKRSPEDVQFGIKLKEMPIHISNVMYNESGRPVRLGYKISDGEKLRYSKKSGSVLR